MKHICIWLIRLYQKWLSPLKRNPTCRFYPTCSAFAIEAFQKRGFFAGVLLTFFRILRCNPFCPGGYDPVPEKGITVRSYYANRKRWITEQENNDCDGGADAEISGSDAIDQNAPEAGGNSQDRGEDAANQNDTPPRACVRYDHTRQAPR